MTLASGLIRNSAALGTIPAGGFFCRSRENDIN